MLSKRVLIKISGESLMGKSNYGIDVSTLTKSLKKLKKFTKKVSNLYNNWRWKYF